MKRKQLFGIAQAAMIWFASLGCLRAESITPAQLTGHGLAAGEAMEVLPAGALVHVELRGLLPVLEGVEGLVKAVLPARAAPPDIQELLRHEHPLLAAIGMHTVGEPLSEVVVASRFGLGARGTLTLSVYPGDPRRLFILSLPLADREALAGFLSMALAPSRVTPVRWGEAGALRVVSQNPDLPELHLVAGPDRLFVCGDRALAMALHQTPAGERMARDPFLGRVVPGVADKQLAVVFDPRLVKPAALQLQWLRPLLLSRFQQMKRDFLANLPPMQREVIEQQVRAQMGVESLEELAEYLDAALTVTSGKLVDFVTTQWVSFQGICFIAHLDPQFPELGLEVYSSQFQPDRCAGAIPMNEVREVLAWLGDDARCFTIQGRQPAPQASPGFNAWLTALREEFTQRGLRSAWFDRLGELVGGQRVIPQAESEVPWTLKVQAPITPQPSLADSATVMDYLNRLSLPLNRRVTVVPGRNPAFLEELLRAQASAWRHNQELGIEFARQVTRSEPWLDRLWRVEARTPSGQAGIRELIFESSWATSGGIFGYDQHELVNRKVFQARELDGLLVWHQGRFAPTWLAGLQAPRTGRLTPATAKLLDRLPEGVNHVQVHRVLQNIPTLVGWLERLENRVRADLDAYLAEVNRILAENGDSETALRQIRRLPMPELLYGVARKADGTITALLPPGNLVYPRPTVIPILSGVLADYAATADEVGGSLFYTQVKPDAFRMTFIQSTEALAKLISTTGNAVFEQYLATPDKQAALHNRLHPPSDQEAHDLSAWLVVNPRWGFLPRPTVKQDARPAHPIPSRPASATARQIDLTPFYNASLKDSWHQGNMANNTLANLPSGLQTLADIPFDVRGIVQLAGPAQVQESRARFPGAIDGIPVGLRAERLHFLHATGWSSRVGATVGEYVVHYTDGAQARIPIIYGVDVLDWWTPAGWESSEKPVVAWQGTNNSVRSGPPLSLYLSTWQNPRPETTIASIDFRSTMDNAAPFLIGLSAD